MGLLRRRTIVLGGLAVAAAAVSAPQPRARTGGRYPFHLGVASGEPDSTSVVLWTRLARDPLAADGQGGMPDTDVAVEWQVSATESGPPGMFVGSYFLVGGGSLGARTVAISRQTASAAFDVTSGL
jgi:hypothetical protein